MQKLVGYHLKEHYDISVVSDGWDAIALLNSSEPQDLILTDIEMAELSGLQLMEMLDDLPQFNQIPVIVMSSSLCNNEELKLDYSNFFGCLPKPMIPDELYLKIEEAFVSKMG